MEDSGQHKRLRLDWRVLTVAKDADYPEENQDVVRVDDEHGAAAIADGVTSSLFARQWATILVDAATSAMPVPNDREALARWLAEHRAAWSRQIDVSRLAWFQKAKLREGAFSTLLAIRLVPPDEATPEDEPTWRLRGLAIGDSCLFLVRAGKVLRKFPIQTSLELQSDPVVLGSVNLNRDELLEFRRLDEPCQAGDLMVLCTDAVADWALRLEESGNPPEWETYWDMDAPAWREKILSLRAEREIRCDDTTLLLLRIIDSALCAESALCAGLPTPHIPGPEVSSSEGNATLQSEASGSEGDLRSADRRDQETRAERGPEPPPVSPSASPAEDWVRKIKSLSEQTADGLAQGLARGMERIKQARQAAQSKLKDYLDRFREDDR